MEEEKEYKFMLLGDSKVGKTSIFKKLRSNYFSDKVISTIGCDRFIVKLSQIKVIDKNIELIRDYDIKLYDTGDNEKFRKITLKYIRDSEGIILIYDITNKESFQNIENWLNDIKKSIINNDDYIIMLLGNKLDKVEEDINTREVSKEEVEKLCSEKGLYFGGEISAKNFTPEEIKGILENLMKQIISKFGIKKYYKQVVLKLDHHRYHHRNVVPKLCKIY